MFRNLTRERHLEMLREMQNGASASGRKVRSSILSFFPNALRSFLPAINYAIWAAVLFVGALLVCERR